MASKQKKLELIEKTWGDCERCDLATGRKQVVFGKGNFESKLAIIGEAPGAQEDEEGKPFVGSSGVRFDELCEEAGLEPWDSYICNVIGCRPPNNRPPSDEEIEVCFGRITSLLGVMKPKALLLLGGTALRAMTGLSKITTYQGKELQASITWQGQVLTFAAVATFHPSYLLRNRGDKELENKVIRDIRLAHGLSKGSSWVEGD